MQDSTCGPLQVVQIPVGMLRSNCYLLFCAESRKAIAIDPGDEGETIVETIRKLNLEPVMILLTHGHGDHIGAIGTLKQEYSIPIAIHCDEADMLTDARANLSGLFGEPVLSPPADRLLKDGDTVEFENRTITVLHTPGHSPGGVSLHVDNIVFTGDALFKETVGRSDLPGSSHVRLIQGIRDNILTLDDETIVYPGHGPSTTVGEERRFNPYLQEIV